MPELKRMHVDHAPGVLAFELTNRTYVAASISHRGDDFFDRFADRYNAALAEQEAGIRAFYVLVGDDGPVLGRMATTVHERRLRNRAYAGLSPR